MYEQPARLLREVISSFSFFFNISAFGQLRLRLYTIHAFSATAYEPKQ